jgi:glycerol kinase
LQRPVVRAATPETTALGAAFLAGLAVGFWKDREELRHVAGDGGRFEPRMPAADRDRLVVGWRRAVERSKGWAT